MRAIHVCVTLAIVLGAVSLTGGQPARSSRLEAAFSRLPLDFIENRGIYPEEVAYYVEGADKTLFFTRDGVTLRLKGKERAWVVRLEYVGGSAADEAHAIAVDPLGNAILAGETRSDQQTFPVRLGPDLTFNGGTTDGFVARVSFTLLVGGGSPRPGGQVDFYLTSLDDHGLPYQIGTSLGTGPIPIDTRRLDLSPDSLFFVSASDLWPWIFSGYRGVIDAKGQARAFIHLPNLPALIGLRIHSAFVTVSPSAPSGIKSISNPFSFSITK